MRQISPRTARRIPRQRPLCLAWSVPLYERGERAARGCHPGCGRCTGEKVDMPRSSGNPLLPLALLVAVLASGGCDTKSCGLTEGVSQPVGPWGAGLGEARPSRARQIMARLGKGSQALTAVI